MKTFTISDAITSINQNLNYPSLSYEDVSTFFDQAIAELNTMLHINLDHISTCIKNNVQDYSNLDNVVLLTSEPNSSTIIPIMESSETEPYYYNPKTSKYYIKKGSEYKEFETIFGLYNNYNYEGLKMYKAYAYSPDLVIWLNNSNEDPLQFNLLEILTMDWIILFLIPYVCFKQSVRDGASGALYSEEFAQGFQQLHNAYNVPTKVNLSKVAGLKVYTDYVKKYLPNLNVLVYTKAITEDMKVGRAHQATYGSMYDKGGWGI